VSKDFFGEATLRGFSANAITEFLKFINLHASDALIFLCGHDYGDISVLSTYDNRFALGGVEE
jgi:hypothetical protein